MNLVFNSVSFLLVKNCFTLLDASITITIEWHGRAVRLSNSEQAREMFALLLIDVAKIYSAVATYFSSPQITRRSNTE